MKKNDEQKRECPCGSACDCGAVCPCGGCKPENKKAS